MSTFTAQEIEDAVGRRFNRGMSTKSDWRFGTKGAFSVNPAEAVWFDHETGTGGTVSALLGRRVYIAPGPRTQARHRKRWSPDAMRLWSGAK